MTWYHIAQYLFFISALMNPFCVDEFPVMVKTILESTQLNQGNQWSDLAAVWTRAVFGLRSELCLEQLSG